MKKEMAKKIVVFAIGGKGGVGKSWLISLLVDWYESQSVKFHAIDMDSENNTLSRFYRDAEFVDLTSEQNLDAMMNRIVASDTPVTVIDMRAASTDRIEPWFRNVDFDMLAAEYSVRFTAIGVVDTSFDSVANIGFWVRDILSANKGIRYVIGRNLMRSSELGYDSSEKRKEYQATLDMVEIEIPKLEEWVHSKLEYEDLRVGSALELKDASHPLTEFMNRCRLSKYQQRVFAEFERIKERLLP
jgi:hypothetical protein